MQSASSHLAQLELLNFFRLYQKLQQQRSPQLPIQPIQSTPRSSVQHLFMAEVDDITSSFARVQLQDRSFGPVGSGRLSNTSLNSSTSSDSSNSSMHAQTKRLEEQLTFGKAGSTTGHFSKPHGFCLNNDNDIVVADTNNHRIQVFTKSGELKHQFGRAGRETGQLNNPRKVAVMRDDTYVVCDVGDGGSRMQLFDKSGRFLKQIAIKYIDIVAGLVVNRHDEIVIVDSVSPTVFRIDAATGSVLAWFDCSSHMREPSDLALHGDNYFVCDFKGHCVCVFDARGRFLRRIGGENVTNFPNGIDVSDQGDVLVGDSHGNLFHVVVFDLDGRQLAEYIFDKFKVSRCCGLKITREGLLVTLAKNNNHVITLKTLFI